MVDADVRAPLAAPMDADSVEAGTQARTTAEEAETMAHDLQCTTVQGGSAQRQA